MRARSVDIDTGVETSFLQGNEQRMPASNNVDFMLLIFENFYDFPSDEKDFLIGTIFKAICMSGWLWRWVANAFSFSDGNRYSSDNVIISHSN